MMTALQPPFSDDITFSLEQEEQARKIRLLSRFAILTLLIVLAFCVQTLVYCLIAFRWPVLYEAFAIVPILGCLTAYKLATSNYRLACWLAVASCLAWVDDTLIEVGTRAHEIVGCMLLLVVASVLMKTWEVIALTVVQAVLFCSIYLAQNTLKIYQPPRLFHEVTEGTTGAMFALLGLPLLTALVLLPAKGQARLLRQQNQRLQLALRQIQARQQAIELASQDVFSLCSLLKDNSHSQASGSQQQVSVITQVASAVTELSATANSIANLAKQVSQAASEIAYESQQVVKSTDMVVTQSEEGVQVVANTAQISEEITSYYQQLVEQLEKLGNQNNASQRILDLLRSIANETHLLALNAAVEAAGAGEYGDRFAVVAREVKNLATRSVAANHEVVTILQGIEQVTTTAVQSAQAGFEQTLRLQFSVEKAEQVIAQMSQVLVHSQQQVNAINLAMQEITHKGDMISTATHQQRSSNEQIVESLSQITLVASQNSQESHQLSQTADSLEQVSNRLKHSLLAGA